ncbi:MAG: hypothetical protein ACE5JL_10675, partial [Dehalococcoidia bacterium]
LQEGGKADVGGLWELLSLVSHGRHSTCPAPGTQGPVPGEELRERRLALASYNSMQAGVRAQYRPWLIAAR